MTIGGPATAGGDMTAGSLVTTAPTARRRPVGWLIAIGALALALLVTLAVLVGLAVTRPAAGDPPYVSAASSAASRAARAFWSISADHVDADLDRVAELSTGSFRKQFLAGRAQTRAAVVQNDVHSTGTVLDVALTRAGPTKAAALVAADARVRNKSVPKGRAAHYRMRLTLVRQHGRWLVSALSFE